MRRSAIVHCLAVLALLVASGARAQDRAAAEAVYRAYHAAAAAGDLAGMRPHMRASRQAEMDATPEANRKSMAEFLKVLVPKDVTIERTTIADDAKSAQLEVRGMGKALIGEGEDSMVGSIHMVVEDGAWKIDTSHWKSEESKKQ